MRGTESVTHRDEKNSRGDKEEESKSHYGQTLDGKKDADSPRKERGSKYQWNPCQLESSKGEVFLKRATMSEKQKEKWGEKGAAYR